MNTVGRTVSWLHFYFADKLERQAAKLEQRHLAADRIHNETGDQRSLTASLTYWSWSLQLRRRAKKIRSGLPLEHGD
jgi:hypothetical protein